MAIEDAVVLGRCLSGNRELVAGLREYEAQRRARTRRMVQTSRVMSAIEQLQHPVPVALRDTYFRMQPRRVAREQARSIMSFADHA
jgi:2-polyprenyl-6-methoxyphenol hydroxylase-like FAD-dependent oxidoreductase